MRPMTTYRRRGHYRRSPGGGRVWVSSHAVTRSSGSGYRSAPRAYVSRTARATKTVRGTERRGPRSLRWARSNARCPVCGAAVYFYANESGSRVYFDEIGPPWPKHPCTDAVSFDHPASTIPVARVAPVLYDFEAGRRALLEGRRIDRLSPSISSDPVPTPEAWIVSAAWEDDRGTLIHFERLYKRMAAEVWRTQARVSLVPGQLVFVKGDFLSFVDMERIELVQVPAYYLRPPSKESFLQRLRGRFQL